MTTCKKCENPGSVVLRKKDFYCTDCFVTNINHKFRASIGKNKVLAKNENVLICSSGGSGSTALLDFVNNGVSLNNHKKLWITPVVLHIIGKEKGVDELTTAKMVLEQCKNYQFDVYIAHISEYVLHDKDDMIVNTMPKVSNASNEQFKALLESLPLSYKDDFLLKVTRNLFIRYGKILKCNYIFTAETSGTLAINLLSNLSNGRGSQVQYDIGFCDNRDEVKILRPIRDISHEELQNYLKIKHLMPQNNHKNCNENSMQIVIKKLVTDLQDNFQSTISTVCKTADKIGTHDGVKHLDKCKLCESGIGKLEQNLSALEATDYSRNVSTGCEPHMGNVHEAAYSNLTMFPHVNKSLCYTCSRIFAEVDQSKLPPHIQKILQPYSNS